MVGGNFLVYVEPLICLHNIMETCKVVPQIHQIVCIDQNGGIGKNGKLPWKIEKDWSYFLNKSLRIQVCINLAYKKDIVTYRIFFITINN